MVKIGKKEKNDELYKAILQLKDEQECYDFFQDLCTISELRAMEQRFEVASLLYQGMIYNDILGAHRCLQRDHQPGEPLFELWYGGIRQAF